MNRALRNDKANMHAKNLAAYIDKSSLPDMTVYRGISGKYANSIKSQLVSGAEIHDKGFVSTSMNERTASIFAKGNILMKITVPKGSKGIVSLAEGDTEQELILQRGTKFVIDKADLENNTIHVTVMK